MRIKIFMLQFLLAATGWAVPSTLADRLPTISGARIGVHADTTRLVFEMDRAVPYKIFTLADPFRIVIDFPEVSWQVSEARMRASAGLA